VKPKRCRGSEILFRLLEETNISKLLNITAGAFLIDQAEELNAGEAGEQIFGTPLERLSDPSGLLGLPNGLSPAQLLATIGSALSGKRRQRRFSCEKTIKGGVRCRLPTTRSWT
jgi:hypothetical protein